MSDVNEIIVSNWLKLCKKQFTMENISVKVEGDKGGSNYTDIDILAVDREGNYYNYEIKWRSVFVLPSTDEKHFPGYVKQLKRLERMKEIKRLTGTTKVKHFFVTTKNHLGKKEEKRQIFIDKFKKECIEVLFFEDIVCELVEVIKINGRYDSEVLQTIRMLKFFEHIK